jgi:rhodanese-related sulfurtransferase
MTLRNLVPADVAHGLATHKMLLIDVREPHEYEAERIHGALLYPLSTFDPLALPDPKGRQIVLQCGSGMRSAKAVAICEKAGLSIDSHLQGGIQAWKAAGLPTITTDPSTGQPRDVR